MALIPGTGAPPAPRIISDAGGRVRLHAPWLAGSPSRAVLVEDALDAVAGVRAVQAFPVTGHVLVWTAHDAPAERVALLAAVLVEVTAVAGRPVDVARRPSPVGRARPT